MLIAGVLSMCAALASAAFGARSLSHNRAVDATQLALRAMAPTQFAAAVMLAAGGVVALAASPPTALVLLIVCVAGAFGTLATGSCQSARFAVRQQAASPGCGGHCAVCSQSCG
jgi:aspartate aminotransferase-like enzyme